MGRTVFWMGFLSGLMLLSLCGGMSVARAADNGANDTAPTLYNAIVHVEQENDAADGSDKMHSFKQPILPNTSYGMHSSAEYNPPSAASPAKTDDKDPSLTHKESPAASEAKPAALSRLDRIKAAYDAQPQNKPSTASSSSLSSPKPAPAMNMSGVNMPGVNMKDMNTDNASDSGTGMPKRLFKVP